MFMYGSTRVLGLACTLLLLACSEATGPERRIAANLAPGEFAIKTSDTEYVLRLQRGTLMAEIPFEFTNVSDQVVSVPHCDRNFRIVLERRQGARWIKAWSPTQMGCAPPAIRLQPGEVLPSKMGIFAGYGETMSYPLFVEGPVEGTYRITIMFAYWDYDENTRKGELMPERLRASNEFTLRLQEPQ